MFYDGLLVTRVIQTILTVLDLFLFIQIFLRYQAIMTTNFTITQQMNVNKWYRHIDLIFLLPQRYLWWVVNVMALVLPSD